MQHSTLPSRRGALLTLAALGAAQAWPALAQSQWPGHAVRIVVPAPAGGTSDIVARAVAEAMRKNTGQSIVVDNRPGGAGAIAADAFLSAPRDGHTLLFAPSSLIAEVPYTIKPRYDPFTDLVPVAELASVGLVLVANAGLPMRNLAEMIAYVKANPGKTAYASYSPGTISHVKGLQFNRLAGTDMQHVGYKGSPPALQDVVGGQVPFMFDGITTSIPHVKAGKLKAFAVTTAQRSSVLPDVPTFAELGYGTLTQTIAMGIFSTPDVPAALQARIRAELLKAVASEEVRTIFRANALEPGPATQTTEGLQKVLRTDYERTGEILRSIDYRPQ